jgi:hypothetical protein
MSRQPFLVAILAFGIVSGMFSPIVVPNVTGALILLVPWLLALSPQLFIFLVYVVGATLSVLLGGVPAALYERATGVTDSNLASMWLWLAGTGLLALPAVMLFLKVGL